MIGSLNKIEIGYFIINYQSLPHIYTLCPEKSKPPDNIE